jgi:flagellar protein FlaG
MDALKSIGDTTLKERVPLPDSAFTRPSKEGKDSVPQAQGHQEKILQLLKPDLGVMDVKLDYSVNKNTDQVVVKVINNETGEVIREIPAKELVALAESMKAMEGLLFDGRI